MHRGGGSEVGLFVLHTCSVDSDGSVSRHTTRYEATYVGVGTRPRGLDATGSVIALIDKAPVIGGVLSRGGGVVRANLGNRVASNRGVARANNLACIGNSACGDGVLARVCSSRNSEVAIVSSASISIVTNGDVGNIGAVVVSAMAYQAVGSARVAVITADGRRDAGAGCRIAHSWCAGGATGDRRMEAGPICGIAVICGARVLIVAVSGDRGAHTPGKSDGIASGRGADVHIGALEQHVAAGVVHCVNGARVVGAWVVVVTVNCDLTASSQRTALVWRASTGSKTTGMDGVVASVTSGVRKAKVISTFVVIIAGDGGILANTGSRATRGIAVT